jgi:hypothetical protein
VDIIASRRFKLKDTVARGAIRREYVMRHVALACFAFSLCAWPASAQITWGYRLPAGISLGSAATTFESGTTRTSETFAGPSDLEGISAAFALPTALANPNPPEPPQGVYGVFPKYDWEVSAGYTFLRFYEVPGVSENANGAYGSVVYYLKDWIGAEGEVNAAFGTLSGSTCHFALPAGGVRLRWPLSGGIEIWGHALAGVSNLSQTPYGKSTAFAYEAGAGVEIRTHRRWAYRIEGDAVGTFFFNTYQVSPKVSAGVVYKF